MELFSQNPEHQNTYERAVYSGILLLFWLLFFLGIKTSWMAWIVAALFSTFFVALYTLFLSGVRRLLEKSVQSPVAQKWIALLATLLYECVPLWTTRNVLPLWVIFLFAGVMTLYYGKTLQWAFAKKQFQKESR